MHWNQLQISGLLSSYFLTFSISSIIAQKLVKKFGGRYVYGAGQVISALCHILFPIACKTHFMLAVLVRLILGLISVMQRNKVKLNINICFWDAVVFWLVFHLGTLSVLVSSERVRIICGKRIRFVRILYYIYMFLCMFNV